MTSMPEPHSTRSSAELAELRALYVESFHEHARAGGGYLRAAIAERAAVDAMDGDGNIPAQLLRSRDELVAVIHRLFDAEMARWPST